MSIGVFLSRRRPMSLAPIAAVEYLEAALSLASNHGVSVAIAQLDLTNRTTCRIDLPEYYRRATPHTAARSTRAHC
jgi:hypothetical protein